MRLPRLFAPAGAAEQPDGEQRRLLAIMVADIVGYSKLMASDEASAFRQVRDLQRDVFGPVVVAHEGAIVKWTGDGFIASFPNAANAVRAGAEIQSCLIERAPQNEIALRIGINTGDTIVTRDDVYGDAVNIAARLQALAEPGQIVVSRSVRDAVKQDASIRFDALGPQAVKNIPEPIDTFRATFDAKGSWRQRLVTKPGGARAGSMRMGLVAAGCVAALGLAAALLWSQAHTIGSGQETATPAHNRPTGSAPRPVASTAVGAETGRGEGGDDVPAGNQYSTSAGREVRVGRSWEIDPANCEAKPPPAIAIVKEPASGRLDVRPAEFSLQRSSAACKGRTVKGLEVFYVPNAGFSGQDHFSYRVTLTRRGIEHDVTVTVN